jgi:Mg2+ and Co2+ transporter CorA
VKAGYPLWHGYRNWEETPSMKDLEKVEGKMPLPGPTRKSFFDDLIYWLEKPEVFGSSPTGNLAANMHLPIQTLLYLICGEWLTIVEYIQTRLAQVEWEISFPEHFLNSGKQIDVALKKLHIWRRLVPLYHRMLTETLQRVFLFPCYSANAKSSVDSLSPQESNPHSDPTNPTGAALSQCQCPLHQPEPSQPGPVNSLREDFVRLRVFMDEFQERIDRLTSVVTASISIDDSHRGLQDTRNVTRLTWLATCFIPLSLTASILSMQSEIVSLRPILGWYFLISLLLVGLTIGSAFILTGSVVTNRLIGFRKSVATKQKA